MGGTLGSVLYGIGVSLGLALLWFMEVVRNIYFRALDRLNIKPRRRRCFSSRTAAQATTVARRGLTGRRLRGGKTTDNRRPSTRMRHRLRQSFHVVLRMGREADDYSDRVLTLRSARFPMRNAARRVCGKGSIMPGISDCAGFCSSSRTSSSSRPR